MAEVENLEEKNSSTTEVGQTLFPHFTIDDVMPRMRELANHYGVGGQSATRREMAIVLKKAENTLVYFFVSAIQYGLLVPVGKGLQVSRIYERIETPVYGDADKKAAKMEAFNNSPLYKKLIEAFNNRILPNEEGLANALKSKDYGVNSVTCGKAAKVFYENGRSIGIIDGNNRLGFILPKNNNANPPANNLQEQESNKNESNKNESSNNNNDEERLEKILVPFGKGGDGEKGYVLIPKNYTDKHLNKMIKFLRALKDEDENEENKNPT